ncbi:MAG TPA: hypothetical protein VIG33_05510 [Pseudobdellovibrionaceae bacterium]|jgi:uncharacterized membrane protein
MKRALRAGLTIFGLLAPLACGKIYNSSTYDATTYGASDGSVKFLAAKEIIKTNCATCHTRASHQAWAGMNEQDFISQGLVVAGNFSGSLLYTKIQGNRTSTPGNMPEGGTLLSGAELTVIEDWILGI